MPDGARGYTVPQLKVTFGENPSKRKKGGGGWWGMTAFHPARMTITHSHTSHTVEFVSIHHTDSYGHQ